MLDAKINYDDVDQGVACYCVCGTDPAPIPMS